MLIVVRTDFPFQDAEFTVKMPCIMYQVISSTSPVCETQYPLITLVTYQLAYELLLENTTEIGQLPVNETGFFDLQCYLYKNLDVFNPPSVTDLSRLVEIDQDTGYPWFYSLGCV